jgi:ATP-dependent RNA helicase DDX24/MAK5
MVYYLATRYSGKTIVFVNSIDAIRRITPMLTLVGVNVYPLHADLQQKQRLKNLERFAASENALLVASDVAARGLDIPAVDHVIHYQMPRSLDIYIHRSGRTARANSSGVSILLISPEDEGTYRKLCKSLAVNEHITFPIDQNLIRALKPRLTVARQLDQARHAKRKEKVGKDWLKATAEDAEIAISDDEDDSEEEDKDKLRITRLENQLKSLLQEKIHNPVISSYTTMAAAISQSLNTSKAEEDLNMMKYGEGSKHKIEKRKRKQELKLATKAKKLKPSKDSRKK